MIWQLIMIIESGGVVYCIIPPTQGGGRVITSGRTSQENTARYYFKNKIQNKTKCKTYWGMT
jgi:hypothetical protein